MHCKFSYRILSLFIVGYSVFCGTILGQPNHNIVDYSTATEYEIGGIKITGASYSDENTIISMTGLKIGNAIRIPGTDIPNAIKALAKLRLFSDIQIMEEKKMDTVIFLEIIVKEMPRFSHHTIEGVPKRFKEDLDKIVHQHIQKGGMVTANMKSNVTNDLKQFFINKGYLDTQINIIEMTSNVQQNGINLVVNIDKKKKVKIQGIVFSGNTQVTPAKLRRKMKDTKRRSNIKSSKFIQGNYEQNKESLIAYYKNNGYSNATISKDSVWRNEKGDLVIEIDIEEGQQFYFGDIVWKGNAIYQTKLLQEVLGVKKGDLYNPALFESRLRFSPDGRDISALYMDNGYLFFQIDPIIVSIENDTIDYEIRIMEGPQATIGSVSITGNDITNDEVIRRELRTLPGKKFSRRDVIRSQREIVNLGYFNPEKLGIKTPVNPKEGTVDIEYEVEERSSDKLELAGNYGGSEIGFVGTVGISFNNFSVKNLLKTETWNPLPQGDGQQLSLRAQTSGKAYQSYNMSFTEPWLGKKKANSFSVVGSYTRRATGESGTDNFGKLSISNFNVGLGTRLKIFDGNFVAHTFLKVQNIKVNNWTENFFADENGNQVTEGKYNNISINQQISRSTIDHPIFPRSGSTFSLSGQLTLPYSLLNNKSYEDISVQDRYRWLEYHKWRVSGSWYKSIVGNLVFKASGKIGLMGSYTKRAGIPPFEKFVFGGDGLSNQSSGLLGYDVVSMRGYDVEDFDASAGGAAAFAKFSAELRFPLLLSPNATIYGVAFGEAGNAWNRIGEFDLLDLKRSAGLGLRVHLPMFGTLGFDYGIGFDKNGGLGQPNTKWSDFGKLSLILGLEPD